MGTDAQNAEWKKYVEMYQNKEKILKNKFQQKSISETSFNKEMESMKTNWRIKRKQLGQE